METLPPQSILLNDEVLTLGLGPAIKRYMYKATVTTWLLTLSHWWGTTVLCVCFVYVQCD